MSHNYAAHICLLVLSHMDVKFPIRRLYSHKIVEPTSMFDLVAKNVLLLEEESYKDIVS